MIFTSDKVTQLLSSWCDKQSPSAFVCDHLSNRSEMQTSSIEENHSRPIPSLTANKEFNKKESGGVIH